VTNSMSEDYAGRASSSGITAGCPSRDAAVYRLDDMASGQEIDGPALIETDTTTVLIGAGDRATVTATSWIDIAVG